MEIIKEGDLSLIKKPKYFVCMYCNCEFIADKTEYYSWESWTDKQYYFSSCPTCGASVYVEVEK